MNIESHSPVLSPTNGDAAAAVSMRCVLHPVQWEWPRKDEEKYFLLLLCRPPGGSWPRLVYWDSPSYNRLPALPAPKLLRSTPPANITRVAEPLAAAAGCTVPLFICGSGPEAHGGGPVFALP